MHVAALIRAIEAGRPRALVLDVGELPPDLERLVRALAAYEPPELSLGEFHLELPRRRAANELHLGKLLYGAEVFARHSAEHEYIIVPRGPSEEVRGSLEQFLQTSCIAYARRHRVRTSLDAYLSAP